MWKKILIMGVLMVILSLSTASGNAQQTVKTVQMPISFISQTTPNTNYLTTINLKTPDGISEILSLEILLSGDFQATTNVLSRVRKTGTQSILNCIPVSWITPSVDAPSYDLSFDCTNNIKGFNYKGGDIDLGLRMDKAAQNVKALMRMTYLNNPKANIFQIGGTEYSATEDARTIIHILDNQGIPLNTANCTIDVRNSLDTIIVNDGILTNINDSNGLWSYGFVTSLPYGVYSIDTVCTFNESTVYSADTFHVAKWTEDLAGKTSKSYDAIRVSGTEYDINDTAHFIIQVLRDGVPDSTATCLIDIWKPQSSNSSNLTKVVDDASMEVIPNSNGLFKFDFSNTTDVGLYVADTVCSEIGIGSIPLNFTNNITDSTISSTATDITGSEITLNISQNTPIFAVMSIEGITNESSTATWILSIDDITTEISRGFGGADEAGNIFIPLLHPNTTAGLHTVKAQHKVDSGLMSSRINLLTFGFEDGIGLISNCHDSEPNPITVTGASLQDMIGVECDITFTQDSKILIFFSFSANTTVANKEIQYTVSIDGTDQEISTRDFTSSGVQGALSFITVSSSELEKGTHTIEGRWSISGGMATATGVQLVVFSNRAGSRAFDLGKEVLATSSTTSTVLEDSGANIPIRINNENHVAGFFSLSAESSVNNKNGIFAIREHASLGTTFSRFFGSPNTKGSISVVETTEELSAGLYVLDAQWGIESPATLSGTNTKLIGMGFSTATDFDPVYLALDFHIREGTNHSEIINVITSINDTIIQSLDSFLINLTTEIGQVASEVWNFPSRIINLTVMTIQNIQDSIWLNATNRTVNLSEVLEALEDIGETGLQVVVHSTDYTPGDNGRVFITLTNNNTVVNDAFCQIDIHRPSAVQGNVTFFIENALMIPLQENGLYHIDFIAPEELGIYMISVNCETGQNTTLVNASFDILFNGVVTSGSISDTLNDDQVYYQLKEQDNGGGNKSYLHDFFFNMTDIVNINSTQKLNAMVFNGRLNPAAAESIQFQVFNVSSSSFVALPNELISQSGTTDVTVTNSGTGNVSELINGTNILQLRFVDTLRVGDSVRSDIRIDRLQVGSTILVAEPVLTVAGGGELNIRRIINLTEISDSVWNNSNRTLTENLTPNILINFTLNVTFNGTVNVSINFTPTIINEVNVTTNLTVNVNNTEIANAVWASPNRSLTSYCDTFDPTVGRCVWEFFFRAGAVA